jgi:hypothetical protein
MHNIRDVIDPSGRLLARRLDQLCSALECLSVRLRGTIVDVIGDSIGGFVRDAALGALDHVTQSRSDPSHKPSFPRRERAEEAYPEDVEDGYWYDEDAPPAAYADPQPLSAPTPPERLPTALSAGLQAASFWLRRWTGKRRALSTCAIGMMATLFAFVGGPLALVLLDLAASASQFNALPDALHDGASAIGLLDSR